MSSEPSLFSHIATEMYDAGQIQEEIDAQRHGQSNLAASDLSEIERDVAFVAPRTPTEKKLAEIWAEFLGLEQVGIYNDFFALGGHSIIAVQILARGQEEFQVEIPMEAIFSGYFTVAETARVIEEYQIRQADPDEIAAILEELEGLSDEEVQALLVVEELEA